MMSRSRLTLGSVGQTSISSCRRLSCFPSTDTAPPAFRNCVFAGEFRTISSPASAIATFCSESQYLTNHCVLVWLSNGGCDFEPNAVCTVRSGTLKKVLVGRNFVDATGVKLSLPTARIRSHRGYLSLGTYIERVWHASRRLFTCDGKVL